MPREQVCSTTNSTRLFSNAMNHIHSCANRPHIDRPKTDYTAHEREEPRRKLKQLRNAIYHDKKHIYSITREAVNISLRAIVNATKKYVDPTPPPPPDCTITTSTLFYDRENIPLLLFVKDGLEGVWMRPKSSQSGSDSLVTVAQNAMETLAQFMKPPPIKENKDKRHPKDDYKKAYAHWSGLGQSCGVYHFALWSATGHPPGSREKIPTQFNQVLSADCFGFPKAAARHEKVLDFFRSMAPAMQSLSAWFRALDEERFQEYRAHFKHLASITALGSLEVSNTQCFLGIAVLRNLQVHNHKDEGDVKDGWVAMACIGDFTGGELCLPQLGCKLEYKPGDVVLFRSCALEHYVLATEGSRSSFVFFSYSSAESLKQPVNM